MRSFASTLVTLVVLWSLTIAGVRGAGVSVDFKYPTESLTFNSFDTIEVKYECNLTSPKLYTWCRSAEGNVQWERLDWTGGLDSSALIQLNFTVDADPTNCWFNMRDPGGGVGVNSENFQFNSTVAERKTFSLDSATTSSSTSSSTSTSSSASTSSTQTAASTTQSSPAAESTSASTSTSTPSPSSSAPASPNPGLSTGAQAGIGVGVGILGILIGAAAAIFYRRRKARGNGSREKDISALSDSSYYLPTMGGGASNVPSSSSHSHDPSLGPGLNPGVNPGLNPGLGYYMEVPNNNNVQRDPFAESRPNAAPFVEYALSAGFEEHKFRGMPPVQPMRHEMEVPTRPHEMP
ncbi:hypothetical protein Hte_008356 [Hypoxylon texense]